MKEIKNILVIMTLVFNSAYGQNWTSVGEGVEGNIYDLKIFEGNLYACGRLGVASRGVYFWDGTDWNSTSNFWGISYPLSLEVYNGELYTSGDFSFSNNDVTKVFKWQNGDWFQQGENFTGASWNSVKKIKQFGNNLYAGGQFEFVGDVMAKNIAKWNGQEWENVGEGISGLVIGMDIFQEKLVTCHLTTDTIQVNDSTFIYPIRRKLQILENDLWSDLDGYFEGKNVNLLGVINDELYFGSRDTINGVIIENVGIWNGEDIISIGDTLFHSINNVIEFNNEIYASCQIKNPNSNVPISVVRKRENNEWITIGGTFDNHILSLQHFNGDLFIGGFFEEYDSFEMKYISMLEYSTNLNEATENDVINIYPNPTNSEMQIISENNDLINIEILSIDGKLVWKEEGINRKEFTIDIHDLPCSVYIIKTMLSTNKIITNRILKD